MNEHMQEAAQSALEDRSRGLFHESVEGLDMRVRSRLTQARYAALEAVASGRRPWFSPRRVWTPAAGVTAAALLGAALWFGLPANHWGMTAGDNPPSLEDFGPVGLAAAASAQILGAAL
ncbi:MAG: hypothetical protein JWN43_1211, partial [Gammaproteobacteria bacterium]|nr:hypothetical protein [Gammaproteobacteria bacterium]